MQAKHRRVMREQLDKSFKKFGKVSDMQPPVKGWLRSIREALGMSGKHLGARIGVSQPRIVKMERDELSGAVTLKTMRQAAEAMDCVFVYSLIPLTSLEATMRKRAKILAENRLAKTSHSMLLEDQLVSNEERQMMFESKVEDLLRDLPKDFWVDMS